jgi:hypothetical protein
MKLPKWLRPGPRQQGESIQPVTVESPAHKISEAFVAIGYYQLLTADQRASADRDPAQWLKDHPYLFAWYPSFFVDVTGSVKSSKETIDAAKRQKIPSIGAKHS